MGLVGGEGPPLESANGAYPGLWRYKIKVEVREKFGLAPNLCYADLGIDNNGLLVGAKEVDMSNAAPAIDWADDVKRYAPNADNGAIAGIVRHSLVTLKTRDSAVVSFGNPAETRRVRENFCKQTLGLSDADAVLDSAIAAVGQRMSDSTSGHRVTAYYLLADQFDKLEQFRAAAPTAEPARPLAPWAATMFDGPPPGTADGAPSDDLSFATLVCLSGAVLVLFAAIASTAGG